MTMRGRSRWLLAILAAGLCAGCAAGLAYRSGRSEARKGNWDMAVARYMKALQHNPDSIDYKIALENAKVQASRFHQDEARKHVAAEELDKAVEELKIASNYDVANKAAADELRAIEDKIRAREAEKERLSGFSAMKSRAAAVRVPAPLLSAQSQQPSSFQFPEQRLDKIFQALGKVAGVNVLFDPDFKGQTTATVNLRGVTFTEALDRVTFVNKLFYKVLDPDTVIIVPEAPAKRRMYEELVMQTFYLQNGEGADALAAQLQKLLPAQQGQTLRVAANKDLGAITVIGTPDQVALVDRVIDLNDKPRGEVMVEVRVLEVNRNKVRDYGIKLSNYGGSATFDPTGTPTSTASPAATTTSSALTTDVRAHLLSSLNLADFVVSVPRQIFASFLETDGITRIIASPRLRAAEGKKTVLKIGADTPVPVTQVMQNIGGLGSGYSPTTSYQYRNVGVNLEITPRVSASGDITMELNVEFSLIGDTVEYTAGSKQPTFLTRQVQGLIRGRDGETSLIGGLFQTATNRSHTGVVGLGSVPILGGLLSSTSDTTKETEIVISLTPYLVRAPRIGEQDLVALPVGTQDLVRVPGARGPAFGEATTPAAQPSPSSGPATTAAPASGQPPSGARTPQPQGPSVPVPMPTAVPWAPPTPAPPGGTDVGSAAPDVSTAPPLAAETAVAGPAPGPEPSAAPTAAPIAAQAPTLMWSPSQVRGRLGDSLNLGLVVLGVQDLRRVELGVAYDPTLIEVVDAVSGSLLTLDGAPVNVEKTLEPGRARVSLTRATGQSGSGAIVSIRLRGLKGGTAALRVESLTLVTGTGGEPVAPPPPARVEVVQ